MSASPDVVVVGAGPWGLAAAWRLAAAGARVELRDDRRAPAARVAAGMLGPWSEAADGEEDLHPAMVAAARAWPGFAAAVADAAGADAGYIESGAVLAAIRPEHVPVVRRRLETLARRGEPVSWAPGSDLRELEPGLGPAVAGGAHLPGEHQVEPRRLLSALRGAAEAAGARIVTEPVTALVRERGRVAGVRGADGSERRAGAVVLAAGWAAGRLAATVPLRPVKGQILRLRPLPGAPCPVRLVVRTPSVYLAPRPDGELVVGATMEERGDVAVTAEAVRDLLEEAVRAAPECGAMALAEAAAGLRPATPDGCPAIGPDAAGGLVWAVGGYRHGLLLTPLVAEAVATLAAGGPAPGWLGERLSPGRFAREEVACASA